MTLVAAAAVTVMTAPRATAASFPIFGAGIEHLHTGVAAADAEFRTDASHLAVRSDGLVAFSLKRDVWFVRRGRLWRMPAVPTFGADVGGDTLDVAFAPDGSLLVSSCSVFRAVQVDNLIRMAPPTMPSAVWRVMPGAAPQRIAGQLRRVGASGDGGPALAARLDCPQGTAVDTAGGILIADSDGRVRRIAPDGRISTVAGTGRADVVTGDGGPATRASLGALTAIAALPQGGFAVSSAGGVASTARPAIRIVNPDGLIRTWSAVSANDLEALADGSLLLASPRAGPAVLRLFPDGHSVVAANLRRDGVGLPTETPIVGDPFGVDDDKFNVSAVAATPDGGMLAAWNFALHYVAPAVPRLLAVALRPATRVPRPGVAAHMTLTAPARVTLQVLRGGREIATSAADLPAGDVVLPLPTRIPAGEVLLRVRATGADGQVAAAQAWVFAGGVLPVSWARATVKSRLDLLRTYLGARARSARCRGVTDLRVDCALLSGRACAGVVSLRLRGDGSVSLRQFRGDRRCRLP